jgi:hypothetical protein
VRNEKDEAKWKQWKYGKFKFNGQWKWKWKSVERGTFKTVATQGFDRSWKGRDM